MKGLGGIGKPGGPLSESLEEDLRKPLRLGIIVRLFTWTRPYALKRNILLSIVAIRSVQLPALVWMAGAIIGGPIRTGDWTIIFWSVAGFAAFAVLTEFVGHFRNRLALELGEDVVHDMRNAVFHHLMRMPISFFERTPLGRIISRMTSDIEILRQGVQSVLFVSMVQSGQMMVAGLLMLYYDWVLFSIILGMAPILWALNRSFQRKMSRATREVQESYSRMTANLAEAVNGIRVSQGFARQETNRRHFDSLVERHSYYNLETARASARFVPLLNLNSQFFLAAMLVVGGYRVLSPDGLMEIAAMIQFFFLANLFFTPITNLANQYNQALLAMAGAERIFRVLDTEPEWEDAPDARPLESVRGEVAFEGVGFAYEPGRPVLRDIHFEVPAGSSVALVGHTGSGKSSIINLLVKFHQPTEGRIRIDGRDLRAIQGASLHRRVGIVPQNNFLFSGRVIDNIRFARPEASRREVEAVLRRLDCLDLIARLPRGLDTEVGEKGGGVSLGQRQVICFARAMLADPAILILDEATSAIDTLTEERLQTALNFLMEGRTTFVIAHRLSTIRRVNQVLVLSEGRIIERGTHDSLVEAGGYYAQLNRQFTATQEADS